MEVNRWNKRVERDASMEQLKVVISKTFESELRETELDKYQTPVRFHKFTAELSSGSSAVMVCNVSGGSCTCRDDGHLLHPSQGHPDDRSRPERGGQQRRNSAEDDPQRNFYP